MRSRRVRHCVVCESTDVTATSVDGIVRVTCEVCGATVEIDYAPSDRPDLHVRLEIVRRRTSMIRKD